MGIGQMDNWYLVSTQNNSANELLHMFWEFHDFRIIDVNYSAATDSVKVLFEYDDRELRVLLCFIGNVEFFVAPVDFEADWIFGAALQVYNHQLRWVNCELDENESINSDKKITFFLGDYIKWAIVDKDGNNLEIPDYILHQRWRGYNRKTHQYEEECHEFTVTKA